MSQTSVPAGSALAQKAYSVALFAETIRQPTLMRNLTGPAPKQADAEAKLKNQTSPEMPFVRITDLSKTAGDLVSVDLVNVTGGKPLMGDVNAEGKGEKLTTNSMDIRIDLYSKVVDAGGKMSQQRTSHNLRGLAKANLVGYMARLETQLCQIQVSGARGSHNSREWAVPLASDADFSAICVNTVKAPTYNRHFVANGTALTRGGAQLGSIATTDLFKLEHIDAIRVAMEDADTPIPPIKIADDPAGADEPLWVLWVTPRQWGDILANTSNQVWRTFLQNAWNRKSLGSKHPLFSGEPGLWNGILVRKMFRPIRFNPADTPSIVTVGNRYTATETTATIPALSGTHAVERAILLGAQALGCAYGRAQASDYYASWKERTYNFERNTEVLGEMMGGKAKLRFNIPDTTGTPEPTDIGVAVIDTAVKL